MISATEALGSIERAAGDLQRDEGRLEKTIESASRDAVRLRSEEAGHFRALARLRLDALRQETVLGRLDAAERRALKAAEAQQRELDALVPRRERIAADLATARRDRAEKAAAVGDAVAAIGAREAETEKRISGDVAWQARAATLDGTRARAEAADEKARAAEADRDEKSKPYLADRLFVYLWERGWGTSAYRGGALARLGDGWVARVVAYEPARQNYAMLTEIPKRLRAHADRLTAEVAAAEEALAAVERAALEADGIVGLETAHAAAVAALDAADGRIADLERDEAALERERQGLLDDTAGSGLATALDELADSMRREGLRALLDEALKTPTPEDERIVLRLQEIEAELKRLDGEIEEARRVAVDLAGKRAALERSRDEFRRSGYERGGGGFGNEALIGQVLAGIVEGVLSSRDLRDALRSGYRPGTDHEDRPRASSRRSGRRFGGRSGGFGSGGGFSTGGGISSGGGFRTGGGF